MPAPLLFPEATVGLFRPPLAVPALAEAQRTRLGTELENFLLPLVAYCERQQENDDLGLAQFQHVQAIRAALDALLCYDEHTEALLAYFRDALAAAQQLAAAQVPTLEAALHPDWEAIAGRLLERLPLPTPAPAPTPLVARIQRLLATPAMQARAALPLDHRRAIAGITSADLDHAQPR